MSSHHFKIQDHEHQQRFGRMYRPIGLKFCGIFSTGEKFENYEKTDRETINGYSLNYPALSGTSNML